MSALDNIVHLGYSVTVERLSDLIKARLPGERECAIAAKLGISRSHWRHIQAGRREISKAVAARVIALWPELGPIFLAEIAAQRVGCSDAEQQKAG